MNVWFKRRSHEGLQKTPLFFFPLLRGKLKRGCTTFEKSTCIIHKDRIVLICYGVVSFLRFLSRNPEGWWSYRLLSPAWMPDAFPEFIPGRYPRSSRGQVSELVPNLIREMTPHMWVFYKIYQRPVISNTHFLWR